MSDKQMQKHKQKARQAQVKAQINRDKARRKLLRQREKLARRRTRNRHQSETRRKDDENEDKPENPTAHSTVPPQKSNAENAARNSNSTVPRAPKYSDVHARDRLYGIRFHHRAEDITSPGNHAGSSETSPEEEQ